MANTEAIVSVAKDAIITFGGDGFRGNQHESQWAAPCSDMTGGHTGFMPGDLYMGSLIDTSLEYFPVNGKRRDADSPTAKKGLKNSDSQNHDSLTRMLEDLLSGCRMS